MRRLTTISVLKDELAESGCSSLDLAGNALSRDDFKAFSATLAQMFGDPYIANGFLTRQAAIVWNYVTKHGWSSERFAQALERFTQRKFYGNEAKNSWQLFDFLEGDTPDLHDYAWVEREVHKDPTAMKRMEAFRVSMGAETLTLWRYKGTGGKLEFERVWPKNA